MNIIWVLFGVHQKTNLNVPEKEIWIQLWPLAIDRPERLSIDLSAAPVACQKSEPHFFYVDCGRQACQLCAIGRPRYTVFLIYFFRVLLFQLDWIFSDHHLFLKIRQIHSRAAHRTQSIHQLLSCTIWASSLSLCHWYYILHWRLWCSHHKLVVKTEQHCATWPWLEADWSSPLKQGSQDVEVVRIQIEDHLHLQQAVRYLALNIKKIYIHTYIYIP